MSIRKMQDGRYRVDIYPNGRKGQRIRRRFKKKQEAILFERYVMANADKKEWLGGISDRRTLGELLDIWWLLHGQTLENGAVEKQQLEKTIRALGNPAVNRLDKREIAIHRGERLKDGITASTINRDIYRLSGMFTTLIKLGEFRMANPCSGLNALRQKNPDVTYLTSCEVADLLGRLEGDNRLIALVCLSTGARWGECCTLRAEQVSFCRITFLKTKNGKKRSIPISEEVERQIKTRDTGPLFDIDYATFRKELRRVKPDLPRGQSTHVLRHTFATHFMMNGGNIIALQHILGHATIKQTMTYAHFAPDYLEEATRLNPLKGIAI
ncbi:TPA: tyrosine-type recombinase/integrase [Escherichia coli]|nr:tyrosine-type recombinase/integrase [Escherichia coli]HAX2346992.1 tyrosine-type recombinase/integrase [Escherichia coli]HBI2746876.1 tyrosine-type recombinase/integrase [Escherichia coli]HDH7174688.1 tyrosine-type recombinase/integrase [Escherichia coli]HDW3968982.1 tyrosine-type recombinase/integrase [Escherichia coli]